MDRENGANARPRARTDMAEEWVGEEVFLYDHENGDEVHCLNSGATLIWLLCDGTRNLERIASEIAEGFDLPEDQVAQEVAETVERFEELKLVEI